MVFVRLESDWTDGDGVAHSAGDSVDVDAGTLASLQAEGIVSEGSGGDETANWAGPGSAPKWAGPGSAGI
ncbi:hypothetical protein [Micromonospora sp. SL4-19]|uniref:hypothetical protein n=1 Tax=Micromonospora sp. SL4-19 TaxID=3399129 RepID=UPI003A4E63DC